MSYFKQILDFFFFFLLCLLVIIASGCEGHLGLLKNKKKTSLRLNQVYASRKLSIVGSINQKGPLFFHIDLPQKTQKEWVSFQQKIRVNSSPSQALTLGQSKPCSSWVQGRLTKQWIKLNPNTSRSLNLPSYRDLTGTPLVSLSEISFGSLSAHNLDLPLLDQEMKRKQNQIHQDALLDLEGLIAFVGGDQARGRLNFDKGTLEIELYSSKPSQGIEPQNTQINHPSSVQIQHRSNGVHLDRFAPLWRGSLAFPKLIKSDPYPIVGYVHQKENATLQKARKELGVSPQLTSPSSLKSYESLATDFVFLWTFPHHELPQDLWLLVQISPQVPSSTLPSLPSKSSKSKKTSPLYFRIYLNSKYRQDRIKSNLIKSKWHSSKPLILPPNTPIYLLDVHRGPWTCFHPVCLEQIAFYSLQP